MVQILERPIQAPEISGVSTEIQNGVSVTEITGDLTTELVNQIRPFVRAAFEDPNISSHVLTLKSEWIDESGINFLAGLTRVALAQEEPLVVDVSESKKKISGALKGTGVDTAVHIIKHGPPQSEK